MKEKKRRKEHRKKRPNFSSKVQWKERREEIFEIILTDNFLEFMNIKNPDIKKNIYGQGKYKETFM